MLVNLIDTCFSLSLIKFLVDLMFLHNDSKVFNWVLSHGHNF